jgi:amino acid adenylation domain-containing protein
MRLHQVFEAQADRTPDAIAVVLGREQLNYSELDARANQLAHYLQGLGVGSDVPVGIYMQRSLALAVSILGVLKAGGVYLPLDLRNPKERLSFILEDTRARAVLTQKRLVEGLSGVGVASMCVDVDWERIAQQSCSPPAGNVSGENLAYLVYTSGSAGRPKAVMLPHRVLCRGQYWAEEIYHLTSQDRHLMRSPRSPKEFLWPLFTGGQAIMAPPGSEGDTAHLVRLIARHEITIASFTPSLLRVFLDERGLETCSTLRHVFCSGEPLPGELQKRFFDRLSASLHNFYGLAEAPYTTYWTCKPGSQESVTPIGRPADMRAYVLDSCLQPVPHDVAGELYISGDGLARGYLNQPGLTAERFIPNPLADEPGSRLYRTGDLASRRADGNIQFLGRQDHQAKIRGFRVEPGEIESILHQHPAVKEASVVAREDRPGAHRLVGYVVLNPGHSQKLLGNGLMRFMRERLPDYMVPSALVLLDALPRTHTGKLDRMALPPPAQTRPELQEPFVAPRSPVEEMLADIWARVLGLQPIGVHDSFLEMGGHSLLATQVMSRIYGLFQVELPLRCFFDALTIADLAETVEKARLGGPGAGAPRVEPLSRDARRMTRSQTGTLKPVG